MALERQRPAPLWPSWFGRDWPETLWRDISEWMATVPETFPGESRIKVEEYVDGDTVVIRAEMPGIDPDKDVEITVHDSTLRIRASREQRSEVKEKDHYRSEFQYGSFTRVLPLPAGANEADVQASYEDGILEIHVPIEVEQAQARKVPVSKKS